MNIIDRDYVESHKGEIIEAIRSGKSFIYPTDTIYGLGVNALLGEAVGKLRDLKQRPDKPFSIIAPNKEWILEHCIIPNENILDELPGPVTLIVETKGEPVSKHVNPAGKTLGIRIPDHWFSKIIEEAGVPFVTTSVNISGESHMQKLEDADPSVVHAVDYMIYEGPKFSEPSRKIKIARDIL